MATEHDTLPFTVQISQPGDYEVAILVNNIHHHYTNYNITITNFGNFITVPLYIGEEPVGYPGSVIKLIYQQNIVTTTANQKISIPV